MGYEATDFYLNVEVTTLNNDHEMTKNFQIEMITRETTQFQVQMDEILDFLELDRYSNNLVEHYE